MKWFWKKTKSPLADILSQTTATGSSSEVLTLKKLEELFEEAKKIPTPTGIIFRWKLAFRTSWPFVRLMRVGEWFYKS